MMFMLAASVSTPALAQSDVKVYRPVATGWSRMIYEMAQPTQSSGAPPRLSPTGRIPVVSNPSDADGSVQTTPLVSSNALAVGLNFEGLGAGFPGYNVQFAPPDTVGSVGLTQYVQWVNADFAIFDKTTGALVTNGGPFPGNGPWAGFGGGCQVNNDGDPIVQYDKLAHRWIFSQFSVSTTPFLQCFAISQGDDARGPYFRFAFSFGNVNFNDYPKLGIMPNGYYMSYNIFAPGFIGPQACAVDRVAALAGATPVMVCKQLPASAGSVLPADLDGTTLPSDTTQNFFVGFTTGALQIYKLKPDYVTTANTTLTGPTNLSVSSFVIACADRGGGACISQPGTTTRVDSLADRLMYRLAYRNRGGVESMVVNQSVRSPTSRAGVRWYELGVNQGAVTVVQQSTFAPNDPIERWMGSAAMNKCGDIAVGYSAAAQSGTFPGVRVAARNSSDPVGTLQSEITIQNGGGSQNANLDRWGDYSAMNVDPSDDSTFWYTQEYIANNGSFNWHTRIASMKFATCQ
jgi:hypothetical protein